jgi:hypothetical protein
MERLMYRVLWLSVLGLVVLAVASPSAHAQRPYIGYVYPAGGQQGTTFQIRLGGQNVDDVNAVMVSGTGVQARVTECFRRLGNTETTLMREQLAELRKGAKGAPAADKGAAMMDKGMAAMDKGASMMDMGAAATDKGAAATDKEARTIIVQIEKRLAENVQTPANASVSSLVFVEITMAPDAPPGRRELRLATTRGVTNPLVFNVGQLPEVSRKPMITSTLQVLGKEEQALRKRPPEEEEVLVTVPCTANGQIASGEVNRYRFEARKGQRLLISVEARLLNPYVADAVPGWFQPVLTLRNAGGKEVAFCDDYRFKPDPVLFFEVPEDGPYVLHLTDAIYRGREDFVYRLTIGELPFVTSIFPLGGRAGEPAKFEMTGWNLAKAVLTPPSKDAGPGIHRVAASSSGFASNCLPLALDTLPEGFDKEPNNSPPSAQKVTLPIIINGRIDRPDDWDVFQLAGRAGDTVVAEVSARRLDSPLDSVLKLTDAGGSVLAVSDDREDAEAGVNTHHADSYLMFKLPADGTYCVHLGDAARNGGPAYAYRLRLSQPQPDFALYVVPSSLALRAKATASVNVQVIRKDGFTGPISVVLKNPPAGFSLTGGSIPQNQTAAKLTLSTSLTATTPPVDIHLEGRAKIGERDVAHEAVAAEDRMQAFLWRHLVPAADLKVLVYDPSYTPPPKRVPRNPATAAIVAQATAPVAPKAPAAPGAKAPGAPETKTPPTAGTKAPSATETKAPPVVEPQKTPAVETKTPAAAGPKAPPAAGIKAPAAVETKAPPAAGTKAPAAAGTKAPAAPAAKPAFTKQQVASRLRQLKALFEDGLLTDDFYDRKVAECEAAQ